MTFVKVYFLDGSNKQVSGSGQLNVEIERFWLRVYDQTGTIAAVPREQVKYFTTSLSPQP